MTTELEKQFMQCFGIKPAKGCTAYGKLGEEKADAICDDYCPECSYFEDVYPQITDRILLELICVLNSSRASCLLYKNQKSVYGLKHEILADAIHTVTKAAYVNKSGFKHQVQQLFKE